MKSKRNISKGNVLLAIFAFITFLFLLGPMIAVGFSSFTTKEYAEFPPTGFTLKWYVDMFNFPDFGQGIILSVYLAAVVTIISLLLGILASYALVRHKFPGKELINTFFLSPIMVPSLVLGIALLQFYFLVFRIGNFMEVVLGHMIISTPFVIRITSASLTGIDKTLEEASQNLGASEIMTFFKITLPIIKPGLISSALFAFLLSFENVTISVFLAGVFFKPFPVLLLNYLYQRTVTPTLAAISTVLLIATLSAGLILSKYTKEGYQIIRQ